VIKHSNHSREQETQTQQALVEQSQSQEAALLAAQQVGCVDQTQQSQREQETQTQQALC
jgi:hypothetical protein